MCLKALLYHVFFQRRKRLTQIENVIDCRSLESNFRGEMQGALKCQAFCLDDNNNKGLKPFGFIFS